jgi:hypothetical protein
MVDLLFLYAIRPFKSSVVYEQVDLLLEAEGGDMKAATSSHPKYWDQRYRLFSKFDRGISIPDEESWFSVEIVADVLMISKSSRALR